MINDYILEINIGREIKKKVGFKFGKEGRQKTYIKY